jgi:hypothetical protein
MDTVFPISGIEAIKILREDPATARWCAGGKRRT